MTNLPLDYNYTLYFLRAVSELKESGEHSYTPLLEDIPTQQGDTRRIYTDEHIVSRVVDC